MRKLNLKTLLGLLFPVVFLVGVAFWLQEHDRESAKWRMLELHVGRVERVPVTPLEASLGYDTKVLVTYRFKDVPMHRKQAPYFLKRITPPGIYLGENRVQTPGTALYPFEHSNFSNADMPSYDEAPAQTFLFALGKVPVSAQPLVVRENIQLETYINVSDVSQVVPPLTLENPHQRGGKSTPVLGPATRISFEVRKPRERIFPPVVYDETKLKLSGSWAHVVRVASTPVRADRYGLAVDLNIRVKPTDSDANPLPFRDLRVVNERVVDEHGKAYDLPPRRPDEAVSWMTESPVTNNEAPWYTLSRHVQVSEIPSTVGHLAYKSGVSIDGCWPLPVEIELVNHNEPSDGAKLY